MYEADLTDEQKEHIVKSINKLKGVAMVKGSNNISNEAMIEQELALAIVKKLVEIIKN